MLTVVAAPKKPESLDDLPTRKAIYVRLPPEARVKLRKIQAIRMKHGLKSGINDTVVHLIMSADQRKTERSARKAADRAPVP